MSTPRNRVAGAVAVVVLLGVAVLALPASLGGASGYVETHGTSMEPGFHTGDLAVVRSSDHYRVGDVVAYRSELLRTTVLHRIIAIRDGHYTFRGDNNSWTDPETPTTDRLIGKLVLRVPHGGVWLDRLSSPPGLAVLALAAFLVSGLIPGAVAQRTRRTKQKARRSVTPQGNRTRAPFIGGTLSRGLSYGVLAATVLGLLSLGLGAFAWSGPVTRAVTGQQPSDRAVTFSYSAHVPPGPAYDDTTVTSPQPVFRALAAFVAVRFHYRGRPGTVSVVADLAATNGWRSTVPLAGSLRFRGPTYDGQVRLNLDALAARAERAAEAIGLPGDQIAVTVRPRFTDDSGNVFTPELPLTLTATELAPADQASFLVEQSATVPVLTQAPRVVSLAGHQVLTARGARPAALLLLVLAILVGGLVAVRSRRAPPLTEATTLRRRYGHLLVPVAPVAAPPGRPVVDVTGLPALAKLAECYGLLILHWSCDGVETFVVRDEATSYRFRIGGGEDQ